LAAKRRLASVSFVFNIGWYPKRSHQFLLKFLLWSCSVIQRGSDRIYAHGTLRAFDHAVLHGPMLLE